MGSRASRRGHRADTAPVYLASTTKPTWASPWALAPALALALSPPPAAARAQERAPTLASRRVETRGSLGSPRRQQQLPSSSLILPSFPPALAYAPWAVLAAVLDVAAPSPREQGHPLAHRPPSRPLQPPPHFSPPARRQAASARGQAPQRAVRTHRRLRGKPACRRVALRVRSTRPMWLLGTAPVPDKGVNQRSSDVRIGQRGGWERPLYLAARVAVEV
jgi:hypothetical protein